jgi:hypothetical protein
MGRKIEYVAAGLVMAGALAFGIHEITAPRVVASTSTPAASTTFSYRPAASTMTREQCGALYLEMASELFAGARDLANPAYAARHEAARQQYNGQCPALCGQGGCQ